MNVDEARAQGAVALLKPQATDRACPTVMADARFACRKASLVHVHENLADCSFAICAAGNLLGAVDEQFGFDRRRCFEGPEEFHRRSVSNLDRPSCPGIFKGRVV